MTEEKKQTKKTSKKTNDKAAENEKPKRKRTTSKKEEANATEEVIVEKTENTPVKKTRKKAAKKPVEEVKELISDEATVKEEIPSEERKDEAVSVEAELSNLVEESSKAVEDEKAGDTADNKLVAEEVECNCVAEKHFNTFYLAAIAIACLLLIVCMFNLSNKKIDTVNVGESFSFTLPAGYYESDDEIDEEGVLYRMNDNKILEAGTFYTAEEVSEDSFNEYKDTVVENFYYKEISLGNLTGFIVRSEEGAEDAGMVLYDAESKEALQIFFDSVSDKEVSSLVTSIRH